MVDNVCEPFMRVYGNLSVLKTLLIMKGKEFFDKAFCPCFIYNRRKMVCQEQAKIPLVEETLNALLDHKPNSL